MASLDFSNLNSLWCSIIAETLSRSGVARAVISPGSRSTPLVFALTRHPGFECLPVLDERSAAFFALGWAKRVHSPVVLVCTSGSAVANYFPAIVEAHEAAVPLIILSADRPPELRECHSGQTIDQQKIFGGFVRLFHELMTPAPDMGLLRALRQTIAHAAALSVGPAPGPVHLNCPFRDPLAPIPDTSASILREQIEESFFAEIAPAPSTGMAASADGERLVREWLQKRAGEPGIIVSGPELHVDPAAHVAMVARWAKALGCPVLADGVSPLRHIACDGVTRVAHYDGILRSATAAEQLKPAWVLCFGGWPTSKALRAWLQKYDPAVLFVTRSGRNRDGLHGRTTAIPESSMLVVPEGVSSSGVTPEWTARWAAADTAAAEWIELSLAPATELLEPKIAWLLAQIIPQHSALFVASSMPIRDLEYFWPASDRRIRCFHNRGANGIDGTLSTAAGVAHGGTQTFLLTGDLAFLHDTNGLLLHEKLRGHLTVLLVNNRGGGIFEHLPVAGMEPTFEEYFATPQNVDFGKLCAAHNIEHLVVPDWDQFRELVGLLDTGLPRLRVLELRTDRKRATALRKSLLSAVGQKAEIAIGNLR